MGGQAALEARAQAVRLIAAAPVEAPEASESESASDGFETAQRSVRVGTGGRGLGDILGGLLKSDGATSDVAPQQAPSAKVGEGAKAAAEALTQPNVPEEHGQLVYAEVAGGKLFAKGADDAHAIHPSDIQQGLATDCWLLSSLASIAQSRPELIERSVKDLGDGRFEVTLYDTIDDGLFGNAKTFEKVRVIVDGDLPTYAGFEARAYAEAVSEGGTPELWTAVFEKAVAQHLGGYGALTNRSGAEGFELVAGAIAQQHIASELPFEQVLGWFQKGDGLAVVSMPSDLAPEFEAYRNGELMAEHIYYISDVDAETRTVEIRNPFGWEHAPIRMEWDVFKHTLGWIDHGQLPQ